MKSVPVINTHRCTLSAVIQSDIHILRQILDDPETQRFLPELCEEFPTIDSLQKFVVSFDKYLLQDDGILWGIRRDSVFIGFIAMMDIKTNPTLFYAMYPDYRNKGYMKECLIKMIDYVYGISLCDTLMTEVLCDNIISQEILLSIGFRQYMKDRSKVYLRHANDINNSIWTN